MGRAGLGWIAHHTARTSTYAGSTHGCRVLSGVLISSPRGGACLVVY
jgi:hypothetical protein